MLSMTLNFLPFLNAHTHSQRERERGGGERDRQTDRQTEER